MRRLTQGAHEILQVVPCLFVGQLFRGRTNDLINNLDRAGRPVRTCDGQGDAFTLLVDAQDDKLARLCFICHQRCFDLKLDHGGVQNFLFNDFIHNDILHLPVGNVVCYTCQGYFDIISHFTLECKSPI